MSEIAKKILFIFTLRVIPVLFMNIKGIQVRENFPFFYRMKGSFYEKSC